MRAADNPLGEQMRAAGAPEALIEQAETYEAQDDGSVPVLRCNLGTVRTFQRCALSFATGGTGVVCLGIPAAEVHAVLMLYGTPQPRWRRIAQGVQLMGRVAAETINRK